MRSTLRILTRWAVAGSTAVGLPASACAQFSGALAMTAFVTPPVGSVGVGTTAPRISSLNVRTGPTASASRANVRVRVSGGCSIVAAVNPVWRRHAGNVVVRVRDQSGRAHDLRDDRAILVDACGDGRLDAALSVELSGPLPADLVGVPPVLVRIELDAGP